MYWVLVFVWLFCGIQILRTSGEKRFFYFLVGIWFVPAALRIIPVSLLSGHMFYVFMFLCSTILHGEFNAKTFSVCPMSRSLVLVFISCLLIGLFDVRVGPLQGVFRGLVDFLGSYFLFFVGWLAVSENGTGHIEENGSVFRRFAPWGLLMTLYGLLTFFWKENPILDAVGLEGHFYSEYMDESGNFRSFRVTGACVSSSVYGLACATMFFVFFSVLRGKTRLQFWVMVLFCLNIFFSATRAAIIPFLIGFFLFLLMDRGLTKTMRYFLWGGVVFLVISPILSAGMKDYLNQLVESVWDIVSPKGTGGLAYGGSNLQTRSIQIGAAFEFLKEKPLFGHGYAYVLEYLAKGEKHDTLFGMESYLCFIGVEYGLVYFAAILCFFFCCFAFFFRERGSGRTYANLGIALLVMFLFYLVFAWVGGCWFFFMPMLGYVAKSLALCKK